MSASLAVHAVGLIVCYSGYGYLQEKLMRSATYGPDNEHFTSSSLLILLNRLFSIGVGVTILLLKSRRAPASAGEASTFRRRLTPASPKYAYAAVALCNFLSTTCQYEALKYVSYTTQSIAKCSKMIPVLVVGALVWKKTYRQREWVAGGVVLVGCATYLLAQPPKSSHASTSPHEVTFATGLAGTLFLLGYLFFDGLVSTTQERVFGKNPKSSDPFGPESPVLDQMIWTNAFAAGIAVISALLSNVSGTLLPNLRLLLTSPALMWDACLLSAASAVGLILLLNTISSFGALTSSLIMTTRQFLSILINAGMFGNFGSVSLLGWTGVGWVASGIYIKMNRSFDPPAAAGLNGQPATKDYESVSTSEHEEVQSKPAAMPATQFTYQYLLPIAIPAIIVILLAPFASHFSSPSFNGTINGGQWESQLHEALKPVCHHDRETKPYNGTVKTGFVSFPRSGNSYIRSLVERTTGWQTSSVYCDPELKKTFFGECTGNPFFVKTHFPALGWNESARQYYKEFDQAVHVVRNPMDSITSWYHLNAAPPTPGGGQDHTGKAPLVKFGPEHRNMLMNLAELWRDHALYWHLAPIRTQTLRYEDLKAAPIPQMMSMLAFLLPAEELPPLEELACMVETDHTHEAYVSRRAADFTSWDVWPADMRQEVLQVTRRPFCAFGYDHLLIAKMGTESGIDREFCRGIEFDSVEKFGKAKGETPKVEKKLR